MAQAQPQYTREQNFAARNLILENAREMHQITNTNVVAAPIVGIPQNIPLRNVGMCKRLLLEVTGTVAAGGAADIQNLTKWGLANIFSNIQVTDLANYSRINTTGWHLYTLASLRRQMAYGAAYLCDAPVALGSNFQVNNGPNSVSAATGSKTFRFFVELPLAYSDVDLRGAIYSAVVNATWQVQYTINPNFFVASGADPTQAVYQSTTAQLGALTSVTVKVHQIYLDQLPFSNGQPILPYFDLATAYLLQNTSVQGLTVGQDFPIQYPNFRSILSTTLLYDNNGAQNAGSDINYLGIQAANLVFIQQYDPFTAALKTRNTIGEDLPGGAYCLETRISPINTTAFGNMQVIINPSSVGNPSNVLVGWEMLGIINSVAGASSLPAN